MTNALTTTTPEATGRLADITTARGPLADAIELMAYGLTDTSKRQYLHTFQTWRAWCEADGIAPDDLSAAHVIAFLEAGDLSRRTRQARLTHLRRIAQTLHTGAIDNPAYRQQYEQLKLLRMPSDATGGTTRDRKALPPADVYDAFRRWPTDTNTGKRNRALLAVLFYAGLRRSELVALRWDDIDMPAGLLTVQRGKGGKARTIPFASDIALDYLRKWRACVPEYGYVFVPVNRWDGIGDDRPLSTEQVRRICAASGDFKPHDARRTLLTRMLLSGTALPDAQYTAGHKNPQTTLGYAIVKDAREVKGRIRLDY